MGDEVDDYGCSINRVWRGRTAVVSVVGTVDFLSSPSLEDGLKACVAEEPAAVVVDLSETEFLTSAGISVLLDARAQAQDSGIGFGVVADAPATSRPITLLGLGEVLNLHADLDEALAALPS